MKEVIPGHKRTARTTKVMGVFIREMEFTLKHLKEVKPHAPPTNEFVFAFLVGASKIAEALKENNLADELTIAAVRYCEDIQNNGATNGTTKH